MERAVNRKILTGQVVSDRMNKTRIVLVKRKVIHSKYGKVMLTRKKYAAHDEKNAAHTGDSVEIMETRPLSKTKRWRVLKVL